MEVRCVLGTKEKEERFPPDVRRPKEKGSRE